MRLKAFLQTFGSTRLTLELTSGKSISGETTFIGDDFLAVSIHSEHAVSEVVPFTSIATIHGVANKQLLNGV
jgi:hypothetical protein